MNHQIFSVFSFSQIMCFGTTHGKSVKRVLEPTLTELIINGQS